MNRIRRELSGRLRERISKRWGIPFSRHGVHPGVVRFLKNCGPITFVDIGASSGEVAASVESHYGIRRGLLIEPQPSRCDELRRRFSDPRFSIYQCALSNEEAVTDMAVLNWDYSSSILPVRRDLPNVSAVLDLGVKERIQILITRLDTLLHEGGWQEDIDLLKIDVQGAELLALRGAEEALSRTRFLLTEVSFKPLYEGSCVLGQLYDFLSTRGFRLLSVKEGFRGDDGELLQADALFGR